MIEINRLENQTSRNLMSLDFLKLSRLVGHYPAF